MNNGFNISDLDIDTDFSFWEELEKLGFERIDDVRKDFPTEYKGIMYDYGSDSYVKVRIEREEKNFRGEFPKYICIYKEDSCVYVGLQPQSHIVYRMLMANLFPSEYYVSHYEEVASDKDYERLFGNKFNMEYALEKLGYSTQEKSQECLSTKGNIAIYYAVPDMEYYDELGYPKGCYIESEGKTIYKGKMPDNVSELMQLLNMLHVE